MAFRGGRAYLQSKRLRHFVLNRDNRTCQLCGTTEASGATVEVDHIEPWAVNHDSSLGNLRCLCVLCNRRRRRDRALPVDEYDAWIRRELALCEVA